MKINTKVMEATGGVIIPTLLAFLGEAILLMIPWLVTMLTIVIADLAAGLWKSYKLEIPIRFSKACRETMGKMIVYFTFVVMICCIDVAAHGECVYTKWASMLVVVIEGGSIVSNLLKPHGINISLNAILKAFLNHSMLPLTCPEVDEIVEKKPLDEIRKEEEDKFQDGHSSKTS